MLQKNVVEEDVEHRRHALIGIHVRVRPHCIVSGRGRAHHRFLVGIKGNLEATNTGILNACLLRDRRRGSQILIGDCDDRSQPRQCHNKFAAEPWNERT